MGVLCACATGNALASASAAAVCMKVLFSHGIAPGGCQIKNRRKRQSCLGCTSHAAKKMPAFKRAVGFLQGRRGTANHSSPKWCTQACSVSRNGACAVATDGDKYADGCTAAVVQRSRSIQKTGHGLADQRRGWSVHQGWVRSPLHCSTKACVFGFSKTHERAPPSPLPFFPPLVTHATPDRRFLRSVQLPSMAPRGAGSGGRRCRTTTSRLKRSATPLRVDRP